MSDTKNQDQELDLTRYLDVLIRRRWIVLSVQAIIFTAILLRLFTIRPVFQASALLLIEKERGGTAVYSNGALVESSNDDYYQTQYKLLKSESLLQQVYKDLSLNNAEDFRQPNGVKSLGDAINILPVLRSRLIYVQVESHDPQLAANIANRLSQTYVDQNLANQLFISKEVLQALQVKRDNSEASRMYEALPAVVNNTLIQTLKAEYAKLQAQAADLSARYTPKHPAILAVKSNMAALQGQIQAETDKVVRSLKTELSGQLRGNNVRVVDVAEVPEKPVKPRKRRGALLGFLGGLLAGILVACLIEEIDQSLRSQEDVENKLRSPFLGALPLHPHKDAKQELAPLLAKELSLTSEAFRNLRTMVDFAGVNNKANVMMVTSTVQAEGKSYVAANLAVAFAHLGEKVLLIDCDLRRPKLHKIFSSSEKDGLSEFLSSAESIDEIQELPKDTTVPNLKIVVSGTRPPNPSELLNTPRAGSLLAWARSNFDRVIVDSPPVFPINDTLILGRHIPSAIFVVRYGDTRAPLVQRGCQKLESAGIKILGVVINAAKAGGLAYASYGYYYRHYDQYYQQAEHAAKAS